ncbi:uncharacterized protein LOC105287386 [Ooceraea biroi]|uniref:uncharacterized protein LOC105287386 n=1 Tax=Ooceraea biroi TaxID=2015173 RepID=UPI000F08204D|nr:uncharacterized protein LOC105287386 [Ooceraea biroi]
MEGTRPGESGDEPATALDNGTGGVATATAGGHLTESSTSSASSSSSSSSAAAAAATVSTVILTESTAASAGNPPLTAPQQGLHQVHQQQQAQQLRQRISLIADVAASDVAVWMKFGGRRMLTNGEIVEKNEAVEGKPSLINTSCYEEGWLFKVKLSDVDEIKELMNEESYNKFLKSSAH